MRNMYSEMSAGQAEVENDDLEMFAAAKGRSMKDIMSFLDGRLKKDADPIPGNLYRVLYMGLDIPIWGSIAVMLIQFLAPIILLQLAISKISFRTSVIGWPPWEKLTADAVGKCILSALFIFCFCRNAYKITQRREEISLKLTMLIEALSQSPDSYIEASLRPFWRQVSIFIGCWVPILSCLDLFLLFVVASDSKDIVFDALGLLFLFNLADVRGDLKFISTSHWNDQVLGNFYRNTVTPVIAADLLSGDDADDVMDETKYHFRCQSSHPLYRITGWLVWICQCVLPPLFLLTFQVQTKADLQKKLMYDSIMAIANKTGMGFESPLLNLQSTV